MATTTLVKVEKRFGDNLVVRGFDLEIEDGGFAVLVGPSGCGKSTVLRMIAGLEKPTGGVIQIGGKDVTGVSPRDRDVAMVFQSYALYPHMSVHENMAFGLKLRGMARAEIETRVKAAAETLGIQDLLQRKPKALSGGQRQRVAMGRAIVRQPAVFLFDEPLSNLDAKLRVQMRAEIAKLHQRLGTTTIYVTHDQVEAMTLARTIVVMKDGIVQQVGKPLDVYRRPANTFVAGFVGSPAMNFFDCEVADRALVGRGFRIPLPGPVPATVPGMPLVLGVRPEHLTVTESSAAGLTGVVEVIEPLGADLHVLGNVEGQPFTARLDPDTPVAVGATLPLAMEPGAIHLFDRGTGRALPAAA